MNQRTFVFADVLGTKVHTQDLVKHLQGALATHAGEYVATVDETVMLRMARATDAVSVSLAAVSAFTSRGASSVRVGINTGTAMQDAGRWAGPAVELAARVAQRAPRGQVLATATTRQSADRGQIDFIGIGEHTLPGSPTPIALYRAQRVTDVGPPGRVDIDPVCHLAVDATQAVRIPGLENSPAFCSRACAERWDTKRRAGGNRHPEG